MYKRQALERLTEHPDDLSEPDVVLLTQHDAIFTLGTASTLDNLKFSSDEAPFDVVRTERGGEVTYHGPGQVTVDLLLLVLLVLLLLYGCIMPGYERIRVSALHRTKKIGTLSS